MRSFIFENPMAMVVLLAVVVIVTILTVVLGALARFYRRCGADEALVRTGSGKRQVVIGGGIMVYPILHQLLRVSLHSIKLSVERSGRNALVTKDKIKADVTTELFIKVGPFDDDVLAAARSFGARNLDENAISELIEGKLTDALRSVAANQTFMDLHGKRKDFAEHIQASLAEELKKNGLTLENVSITALAMVPVKDLDPSDVFDAEGLRAITESVQSNAEKTNQIQRDKEVAIRATNVDARKRSLAMEQDQAQAEADQARKIAEYTALQQAETAKAVYIQQQAQELAQYDKKRAVEGGRIAQEQAVEVAQQERLKVEKAAQIATEQALEVARLEKEKVLQASEIARQKALEAATIEKQKVIEASEIAKQQTVETARIGKQIAITQSEEQAARAEALKSQAEAEKERALQAIKTVEEVARANREKEIALIKADEAAQQSRVAAERDAYKVKLEAETRAAAVKAQAEGEAASRKAQAEGEVSQARGSAQAEQLRAEAQAAVVRTEAQALAARVKIEAEARAAAAAQEAQATIALAEATLKKGEADAQAHRLMVDAQNAVASRMLLRDIAVKGLEVLPGVTRELMTPARAIGEIKVLQLHGLGANGNTEGPNGAFGVASPVLKTVLEAGAAYPLLRELLAFSKVDTDALTGKASAFLASLPEELQKVVDADPALARKVSELTGRPSGEGISVRAVTEGSGGAAPPTAPSGAASAAE